MDYPLTLTTETIVLLVAAGVAGVLLGAVVTRWRLLRRHRAALEVALLREAETAATERRLVEERLQYRERTAQSAESVLRHLKEDYEELSHAHRVESADAIRLRTENRQLTGRVEQLHTDLVRAQTQAQTRGLQLTEMRTRLEETERSFAEKQAFFDETSEGLKKEFQLLANQIFEKQGEAIQARNQEQLTNVLAPFKTQLSDFREKVEQVYTDDVKDRASILTEVRNLQRASERFNEEAENLTRALKGDKRLQGNWGELVLERVLEESGLRKGHEYILQHSLRDEEGDLKRPDVIIRLPDGKDVVVDSKVSLAAYEAALGSADDDARELGVKRHVQNIRTHVRRLSRQAYDQLPGVQSLDFVLLFIPIESAFTLAMERDPSIFTEAFEQRLVIVSPTTLMMTLRIIDNVWRYEKQNKNAQEIARRAGALYDKLRVILEDMDQLGRNLGLATRSYESAFTRLAKGRGNLVHQVEQFRELGATVKRSIPQEVLDAAADEAEPDQPVSLAPAGELEPPPQPQAGEANER